MKKTLGILFLLALCVSLAGGGWLFRTEVAEWFAEETNAGIVAATDFFIDRYDVPRPAAKKLRQLVHKMDVNLALAFFAEPQEFIDGKTEQAKVFMNSPAGRSLKKLYDTQIAPRLKSP